MSTEQSLQQPVDGQNGYLTLPFDQAQFKTFIIGLLGKPQTIARKILGNFEIEKKDLLNFHNLIDQRITQQNRGQLIQVTTQIYFSDNSYVLLSSYPELASYHELKDVISVGVRMTWVYLIQFQDKTVPERQEIEIMIRTNPPLNILEDYDILWSPHREIGQFDICIRHTARTWGVDIEGILTKQINSLIQKENKLKSIIRKNHKTVGLTVAILFLLCTIITISIESSNYLTNEVSSVNSALKTIGNDVSAKEDLIINYIIKNPEDRFTIKSAAFLIVALVIAIIITSGVSSLANNKKLSHVILTAKSEKYRLKCNTKQRRKFAVFILSVIVGIGSGLISNWLFKLIWPS